MQQETLEFDVLIIGAGPAGLSTAIQLAKYGQQKNQTLQICVLEKSAEIGGHLLSGAILESAALTELIPNWRELNAPVEVAVSEEQFCYLNKNRSYRLPTPTVMKNHGNHIISLCELCRWLAEQATQLGVNIFPGFAAKTPLFNENKTAVIGIETSAVGLDKNAKPTERYQAGMRILAKQVVLAEGTRGSITKQIIQHFNLRQQAEPQTYALGIKELWKIPLAMHQPGKITHTVGWPLDNKTYGGGFIYHFKEQLLSIGLVLGLDYQNPYLDPFQELQRFKLHPSIKPLLQGGECISYGARTLNEGGWQCLPKLTFPGGLLVGCAAGMINVAKIKGIHNALRSGMLAAKAIVSHLNEKNVPIEINRYEHTFQHSSIARELRQARNLRAGFHHGLLPGLCYAALDYYLLRGAVPWTLHHQSDHLATKTSKHYKPINYPKPDGKITFDKLTQVFLSGTRHREDQPCHLILKNPQQATQLNLTQYAGLESRYCPAAVYEFIDLDTTPRLQINFTNCIHCKACDVKDPKNNITWQPPEGGGGPNYRLM